MSHTYDEPCGFLGAYTDAVPDYDPRGSFRVHCDPGAQVHRGSQPQARDPDAVYADFEVLFPPFLPRSRTPLVHTAAHTPWATPCSAPVLACTDRCWQNGVAANLCIQARCSSSTLPCCRRTSSRFFFSLCLSCLFSGGGRGGGGRFSGLLVVCSRCQPWLPTGAAGAYLAVPYPYISQVIPHAIEMSLILFEKLPRAYDLRNLNDADSDDEHYEVQSPRRHSFGGHFSRLSQPSGGACRPGRPLSSLHPPTIHACMPPWAPPV